MKVNDPANPGKIYLCGKGISRFDPLSPGAAAILGGVRARDGARIAEMIRRCVTTLAERGCPIDLTGDAIVDALVKRHGSPRPTVVLQERHVAQAIQEALFAAIPSARAFAFGLADELGAPRDVRLEVIVRVKQHGGRAPLRSPGTPPRANGGRWRPSGRVP